MVLRTTTNHENSVESEVFWEHCQADEGRPILARSEPEYEYDLDVDMKVPFAFTERVSFRLSCTTGPPLLPARFTTVPPMVKVAGEPTLLLQAARAKEDINSIAAERGVGINFIAELLS